MARQSLTHEEKKFISPDNSLAILCSIAMPDESTQNSMEILQILDRLLAGELKEALR